MSFWEEALRGLFAVPTGGLSEVVGRKNQFGRTVTGGLEGGAGGFVTGGPVGAAMGAGTGMGLSGTGTTNPYSLKGGAINAGSGAGAGSIPTLASMMGSGGTAGAISGGTPTAGVNGVTTASGATGMGQGMATPATASQPSQLLQMMRSMPMGGGQTQPPQQDHQAMLQKIYQMYPQLRPHFGGM